MPPVDQAEVRSYTLRRKKIATDESGKSLPLGKAEPIVIDEVEYQFYPDNVNGLVLGDLMTESIWVSDGNQALWSFLEQAFPNDYAELRAYLRSPDVDFEAEDFGELVRDLIQVCAERPTTPSPSSRAGRRSPSRTSTARSRSRA